MVAEAKTGSTPPTSRPEFFDGEIEWFTPGDIGNSKQLSRASRRISAAAISARKATLYPKGSLLVTCIGQIGRVGILDQASSSNQQVTALTFTDKIDASFAYYWFTANRRELEVRANQAVVPILNNERLFEIELSHPEEIDEQRQIAERLDQADHLRCSRRYALELTDTVLPAAFLELFGDPIENPHGFRIEPLEELIQPTRPITYGILMPGPDLPNGVPYIRVTDIQDGQIVIALVRRTTQEIDEAYKRSKLEAGDLLLSIRGHVGRMAIVPACLDGANITQDTARLATVDSLESHYLMGCLASRGMQHRMLGLTRGAAVQGINLGDVKELPIPVPLLPLQRRFASLVERVERLRAVQREALRQAEHLFASLLHRAFSG